MSIYQKVIDTLVAENQISPDESILVLCGGQKDREVLINAGMRNVTISNLDHHHGVREYAPYQWQRQDAEDIHHSESTFDWAIVHAGLHHCGSPHRALCEMLRVARKGVIVFEARDNFLSRLAVRCGLTSEFETAPAVLSDGSHGGYRNSPIPNYVYRWTERVVEGTSKSYVPTHQMRFRYFYGYRIPTQRLAMSEQRWVRSLAAFAERVVPLLEKVIPKQGNEFGFVISKLDTLNPWLREEGDKIVPDLNYLSKGLNVERYRRTP